MVGRRSVYCTFAKGSQHERRAGKKRRVVASSDEGEEADTTVPSMPNSKPSSSMPASKDGDSLRKKPKPGPGQIKASTLTGKKTKGKPFENLLYRCWRKCDIQVLVKAESSASRTEKPKLASVFAPSKSKASSSSSATNGQKHTQDSKGKAKAATASEDEEGAAKPAASDTEISGVDDEGNEQADDSQAESEEETEHAIKL